MIAYLEGKLTHKSPTHLFIDVGGVAYHVNISLNTYAAIEHQEKAKIFTHLIVKEDSHTLFGFQDESELELFRLLISVSGIGGNTARVILSYMNVSEVKSSILNNNSAAFNKVKGVGPKTAQRIILDLKDKVAKLTAQDPIQVIDNQTYGLKEEALEALSALGIQRKRVEAKVEAILNQNSADLTLEGIIKEVLKQIS